MKNLKLTFLIISLLSFSSIFGQVPTPCDYLPDTIPSVQLVPKEVTVKVQDAYRELTVLPAQYKVVYKKGLVREGYEGYRRPKYTTVFEQYLVKESHSVIEIVPPVFEEQNIEIEVHPFYTALVKVNQSIGRGRFVHDGLCTWKKIKIPSKVIDCPYKMLIYPTKTKEYEIPAEYIAISYQVVSGEFGPISEELIKIEPKYIYITKKVLYAPARTTEIEIPAITKTITTYEAQTLSSVPSLNGMNVGTGGN